MGLIAQIQKDIQKITSNLNEFGVNVTITSRDGDVLETVGTHKKHHIAYDEEGTPVNSKNATVSVSEQNFIDNNFPYRDSNEEVNMIDYRITVSDSSGVDKDYIVRETYPDETIGLIVFILGDYE